MMTKDLRAKRADQVRETMRHIRMPVEVLEMAAGPDELSGYATTVASLAAGCMVDDKAVSSTELAVIAYQYGWTRRQTEVAAQVLRMNDVWKENKHEKEND